MRKTVVLLMAGTLSLIGCGGDDGDGAPAESPIGKALAAEILREGASGVSTQDEALCVSGGIVSGIGEDRLAELGMTVDEVGDVSDYDFTDTEVGVIVDSLLDCVDVTAALAEEMTSEFGGEGAECVAKNLDKDFVRDMMIIGLQDPEAEMPDEFFQTFLDIAAECDLPLN